MSSDYDDRTDTSEYGQGPLTDRSGRKRQSQRATQFTTQFTAQFTAQFTIHPTHASTVQFLDQPL